MANQTEQYYYYNHKDSSIQTVGDFVNDLTSIVFGWQTQDGNSIIQELLLYKDVNNISNIDRLLSNYSQQQVIDNANTTNLTIIPFINAEDLNSLPLPVNTIFALPLSKLNREVLTLEGNQVVETKSVNAFLAESLIKLLGDPDYKKVEKIDNGAGITQQIFPAITVWLWCRALSQNMVNPTNDLDGTLINITPYVRSIQTSVIGNNGGNFNITLPPIIGEWNENTKVWEIKKDSIHIDDNNYNYTATGNFHSNNDPKQLKRSNFYFNRVINENDLIFIRFESLKLEGDKRIKDSKGFEVGKENLPGRVYDMIALVDNNTISTNPASNDVTINVTGRDLMKLFIEDGTYFYPNAQFTNGGIFGNENDTQRLQRFEGKLLGVFQQAQKTIDQSLKFIINALGTVSICPDSLFEAYGEQRSRAFKLTADEQRKRSDQIKDIEDKTKAAQVQIQKSREADKITPPVAVTGVSTTYNNVYDFLIAAKEAGVIDDSSGFPNWTSFAFSGEILEDNTLSHIFDNELFKTSYVWRDGNGKIITNIEKNKLIVDLEKGAKDAKSKRADVMLGKDKSTIESVNKTHPIKKQQGIEYDSLNLSFIKELQDRANQAAVSSTTFRTATGLSPFEEKRKIQLELLNIEYNELKRKEGSIKLCPITKKIDDLNEFAKESIKLTWEVIKSNDSLREQPQEFEQDFLKGIWQIIKLVIDDSIAGRRIIDPSLGNELGSLINALRKICQEPFVELFSDTYGDQFYLIARKLPFDEQGYKGLLKSNLSNNPSIPIIKDIIIDIAEEDIIDENLTLGNEVYSWYRLQPKNLLAGSASEMAFTYLKAIYFKEFADVWGSKPYDIMTNYIPFLPIINNKQSLSVGYFTQQGVKDLQYLIQSHVYLPFTRRGVITINGDRRIKKGTLVRVPSLGEVFYVDGVTQSYNQSDTQIDRITSLQVSRGMVEKYIDNYFKIVNIDIDPTLFNNNNLDPEEFNKRIFSGWHVNREIFNFFLKKEQFKHDK